MSRKIRPINARLAGLFGGENTRWRLWQEGPRPRRRGGRAKAVAAAPEPLELPADEVSRKARAYLRKLPPAVEGEGGNHRTFQVACGLVRDFGLDVDEALPFLWEWNQFCVPPWTSDDLVRKLDAADLWEGP